MEKRIEKINVELKELNAVIKTLPEVAKKAVQAQINNLKNELLEITKHEKAVKTFSELTTNTTQKFSKRDAAAIALLLNGVVTITTSDIKQVLSQSGINTSASGNQYTQGLPQLLNTAKVLNISLEIKAVKLEKPEVNNK